MFTFVYASLLPLGVALTCCSLFCIYWTEKFLLLKRDSKPAPTGSAMAEAMVSFYIKLVLLLFSVIIIKLINSLEQYFGNGYYGDKYIY